MHVACNHMAQPAKAHTHHVGRFKDEQRHQQRLSEMRARCSALFDGVIAGQFTVHHHKSMTCLVCGASVIPYEAYHVDALRKVSGLLVFTPSAMGA
jgi:hypothetical protein